MDKDNSEEEDKNLSVFQRQLPASSFNYLIIGNQGVGKSTILNCVIAPNPTGGRNLAQNQGSPRWFPTGSDGYPLTLQMDIIPKDQNRYIDTPGWHDVGDNNNATRAALEITSALRQGGDYKLCCVVTIRKGKVVEEDMAVIKAVMIALAGEEKKQTSIPYFVVYNFPQQETTRDIACIESLNYGQYHLHPPSAFLIVRHCTQNVGFLEPNYIRLVQNFFREMKSWVTIIPEQVTVVSDSLRFLRSFQSRGSVALPDHKVHDPTKFDRLIRNLVDIYCVHESRIVAAINRCAARNERIDEQSVSSELFNQ